MAINIIQGFNPSTPEPIDSRFSVSGSNQRLGKAGSTPAELKPFEVYEGLVVYQRDNNTLYVLTDTASYTSESAWKIVGSDATSVSSFIATGSVTASVDLTSNIFLIRSASNTLFTITSTGQTTISGSAPDLFMIKGVTNNIVLTVSQSGVVIFSTQSSELISSAPYGGMYFTSNSFYVGID